MIHSFKISNFKSLSLQRGIEFRKGLNIIVGLNGAGKSTLLQALSFVCALGQSHGYENWLSSHGWTKAQLFSRYSNSKILEFSVSLGDGRAPWLWNGRFTANTERCVQEMLRMGDKCVSVKSKMVISNFEGDEWEVPFLSDISYQGSLFSTWTPGYLKPFSSVVHSCFSLDLLAPNIIRTRVKKRENVKGIGLGGEQLAYVLMDFDSEKRRQLLQTMQRFYPRYAGYMVRSVQGGAKELLVLENVADKTYVTEASQICDGLLRVLAITVETMVCQEGTILIDELEDGLNPELLERFIDYLENETQCQIILTTHHPLVLSCLTDEQAKVSVKLMYRTETGASECVPFFSLPTTARMLETLYPGEVMLRCNLDELTAEAQNLVGIS